MSRTNKEAAIRIQQDLAVFVAGKFVVRNIAKSFKIRGKPVDKLLCGW